MLYTYVNYISHLVFVCIQSSEIFKINRICVLFVLMTFLKRNKTYKLIFTWIHSKYIKCFLTSNETFSSKIGEIWKAMYICEDIAHVLILHISSIKYEYCTFCIVLLLHMCWKVNIFLAVKMVFVTYYFWWKLTRNWYIHENPLYSTIQISLICIVYENLANQVTPFLRKLLMWNWG